MADISVANGGQTAAVALVTPDPKTTPLATLLSTIQQQLNDNVQGYPRTAPAIAAAIGAGAYTTGAGYLCNEASGNLASTYGTPATLTAAGTPVYGIAGPRGGIDKAVGFDANADQFAGGTGDFDVNGTSDLIVAWVGKYTATPGLAEIMFVKGNSGAARWTVYTTNNGILRVEVVSASGTKTSDVNPITSFVGSWYVGMAVIDRGAGNVRIGVRTLAGVETLGASTALFVGETLSNADAFTFGNRSAGAACINQQFAAFYVATGSGCAAGMAAGLSTALANFANAVNAGWLLTQNSTTGLVSIGYTTPPAGAPSFSFDWTNTTLRDSLGFARNINYPTTPAEVAADIGGAWTTGAGYLCNESSGNPASVFGTPAALTASSLVNGFAGPRGGSDLAIGFDSANDNASGGDVFDVTATDDLCVTAVLHVSANPAAERSLISKFGGGTNVGWYLGLTAAGNLTFSCWHVGASQDFIINTVALPIGEWCVVLAAIDRATGKARVGARGISSGTTNVSALTTANALSYANTADFMIGRRFDFGAQACTESKFSAVYVVAGSGVAAGIPANMSTALASFAAKFAQTQTGKVEAFASSAKYARMMSALLPPGKLWR